MSQKLQVRITKYSMCIYWGDGGDYAHMCTRYVVIGGSRGVPLAWPPPQQQDPFLWFSHSSSPKSVRVGGRCPPPPQREILDLPLVVLSYVLDMRHAKVIPEAFGKNANHCMRMRANQSKNTKMAAI